MNTNASHKKIGLVLSSAPGYSETFFRNKIRGLEANGYEVTLFVDQPPAKDQQLPCKTISNVDLQAGILKKTRSLFHIVFKSIFSHFGASLRLFRLERKDGRSIKEALKSVVLNEFLLNETLDWLHFGFGMLAHNRENVAEAIHAKMAVSFRGFDLYLSPLKHPGCYDRLFKKQVSYHVLSNEMKQTLIAHTIPSETITVITPAIDVAFFSSEAQKTPNVILQIVTVARLHWKKGIEYTLEPLSLLKKQHIAFHYKIIGVGEERERLVFAAHQLGIEDHVEFMGKLSPEQVKGCLNEADLYVQYSIQEGFCNAVVEAQSMGLLCIVSNAEGLSENVINSKTGWVVPKRQPALLAQKIIEVHQMPYSEKEIIKQNAVERAKHHFNLEAQHTAFDLFYKAQA
ncbi:MAG: glycosyltransferase family 4 protein [Psychroserpens sp.]|uniref:glycosyltransferase family 4 protein n=1 Tax=Psychroserpens sp. TaxID=2020870 RepID=UPI003CA90A14